MTTDAAPLSARITRAPVAFEPGRGDDALSVLPGLGGPVRDLVHGMAGSSPYLNGLARREAAWLETVLASRPEDTLSALLDGVRALPREGQADGFRQGKRRLALLTALCDLGGVWTLEQVTGALTDYADATLDAGLSALVEAEAARGKLPGLTAETCAGAGGMVVLAMGKMGAHELNYSSDIDVICLFDQDRFERADFGEARAGFIRITRRLMGLMSDLTGEGYVFRTDLRLRPDPSVTPVCIPMEAAERYYESIGRGWERAAHIKARPAAGDLAAGAAYLDRLAPFVWRKHLDFVAVRESEEMRTRIRTHKGLTGPLRLEGHDMKLGAGGIREIEFFTQTYQMISGGRDPSLRERGTVPALAALARAGWVQRETAASLTRLYRHHRRVEHAVQMVQDAQTHALPRDPEGLRRIGCLLGEGDPARFRAGLEAALRETAALTEPFFRPPETEPVPAPTRLDAEAEAITERWRSYPALRSERALSSFRRLRPEILSRLDRAADPHDALLQFDGFLSGLPAGAQLFALFEANPQLVDLIVDICATAPALARYLARNAGVLDAVIGGPFFAPWPGSAALKDELAALLARQKDYEKQLDAARRWQKEWHFRIGVHHLRGLIGAEDAAAQYADLAEAVLGALTPCVTADLATRHGPPPGRGAVVVGMGSLGARRLSARSDLDLIVIYDAEGAAQSDGPRPLAPAQYFARWTKALVTALSAQLPEGVLYEVDMRLRPSGRQGPVAVSLGAFTSYQREEAWTWEHLALTRARGLGGDTGLLADVAGVRRDVLARAKDRARLVADTADMRARLAEAKPGTGLWDAKAGPGRMTEIELLGQLAALLTGRDVTDPAAQLACLPDSGLAPPEAADRLIRHHARLTALLQTARLLTEKPLVPEDLGQGGCAMLLRETAEPELSVLSAHLAETSAEAARIVEQALKSDP